ncbi:type II and III secretion system protein family protein [Caulobacter sp. NIBR2454]|uniref:type II and III secretion system protein family protein n=1 Tax=Caulobacter sp. NIBR2454 TaxID=3015996 RepID=UPI0022B74581|nr:hypothetical protein [Caulobacter sp. NIBR2454]
MIRRLALLAALLCIPAAGLADEAVNLWRGEEFTLTAPAAIRRVTIDAEGVVAASLPSANLLKLEGLAPGRTKVRVTAGQVETIYDVVVETPPAETIAELDAAPVAPDLSTFARREAVEVQRERAPSAAVTVDGPQMVAVDIHFYTITTTTLKALGLNLSDLGGRLQGAVFAPGALDSFSFDGDGLQWEAGPPLSNAFQILVGDRREGALGMFSALSSAGLSELVAQPTLLVRSGESADFLAGGELPIPVAQGDQGAVSIEFKRYGVSLEVEATVLSTGRIVLKLAPEVSEIDYANQITIEGFRVPGLTRRSASTTIELGDGQSFIVAGLSYASTTLNDSAVPGLGSLPVIGGLFKTQQSSGEKRELIIVATPRLVGPLNAEDAALAKQGPQLESRSTADVLLNRKGAAEQIKAIGLRPQ